MYQNKKLTSIVESRINPQRAIVGSQIKRITLERIADNKQINLDFQLNRKKGLIFFLSQKCKACNNSKKAINEILKFCIAHKLDVYLVYLDSIDLIDRDVIYDKNKEYFYSINWELNPESKFLLPKIIPNVLLVNEKGKIIENWRGQIDIEKRNEIIQKLTQDSL
ncbi:hypothetical protein ABRY23_12830 [Melioribacteraceae bacterium 4301-Me]|uniref:hypothetical protein n=1 Tax=Pyranulibacter aquaticus TaxID=3163344 RepID=UPI003598AEDD